MRFLVSCILHHIIWMYRIEWINAAGNDVTQELIDYLTPLIQGESNVTYENGLPVYMDVSHLTKHQ